MRVLAIDPGSRNIGIAISDATGTIARPLEILRHRSRSQDAMAIAKLAAENTVSLILVGQVLDDDGIPTYTGRQAARLAAAIRSITEIPVELWDESFSTKESRNQLIEMGVSRRKRKMPFDDKAAAVFLQRYLDSRSQTPGELT